MKIQASSVHRILNCPYSLVLEQNIPEGLVNAPKLSAASFGHALHDIAEQQLKAFIDNKKVSSIPKMIVDSGIDKKTVEFDKGFYAVNTYVKYIKKHIRKFEKNIKYKDFNIYIEEKIKFKYGRYTLVAKMDCMTTYVTDQYRYIDIFDLKTGNWDYSGSAFSQMLYTVILFLYKYFQSEQTFKITIHTIQPNYWLEDKRIIKDFETYLSYPKEILNNFLSKIHENETLQEESYCLFCPGLLICPKAKELLLRFESIKMENIMNNFEELEFIQEKSDFIKTFLKGVEAHLIENEKELKKFRVKHNTKSKKLIKIENPFEEV